MPESELLGAELRRYSKQIDIPEIGIEGQIKLKKSKVLIAGAGAIGTPVLQYLAAAGIGTLGICDNATINESHFHCQIMYGASDLGKLKTIVAKEKLKLHNPFVEFNIHNILLNEQNAAPICNNYDCVVDCTNNLVSNEVIFNTCRALHIPSITGMSDALKGWAFVSENNNINLEFLQKFYNSNTSANKGNIGVVSGLIGCVMTNMAIIILLGIGISLSGKLITFDASNFLLEEKAII